MRRYAIMQHLRELMEWSIAKARRLDRADG